MIKVLLDSGVKTHQVFPVMTMLLEGHVFSYGRMMKQGIRPALAKSAIADAVTADTQCCSGGLEKLSCGMHHIGWAYAVAVEALWNAASK
jgi:hypothetical protein